MLGNERQKNGCNRGFREYLLYNADVCIGSQLQLIPDVVKQLLACFPCLDYNGLPLP